MAEVVATVVEAVASMVAVADFMAEGFPAAATVSPTAVITVADTVERAALTAVIAEGMAPMAAAVLLAVAAPTEECAAPLAPTMPGHPKVEAFATHPPAGMGLSPAAAVVGCPPVQDVSEELPISAPPLPMAASTPLAAPPAADSPATASIVAASWAMDAASAMDGVMAMGADGVATVGVEDGVVGAGAAVGVGAWAGAAGAWVGVVGIGLTGVGTRIGIPIGLGLSTDTSKKEK